MTSTKPAAAGSNAAGPAPNATQILPARPPAEKPVDRLLARLERVQETADGQWMARCPAHNDTTPSLSVGLGRSGEVLVHCFAGCQSTDVLKFVGLTPGDLFTDQATTEDPSNGVTLAEYAAAKGLDADRLTSRFGLVDTIWDGKPAVGIPYLSIDGADHAGIQRFRIGMTGSRFRWEKGAEPSLYNLPAIVEGRLQGRIFIVEGESDVHALDHHGVPAVGVPGAKTWSDEWAPMLAGVEAVYAVVEPDAGGAALRAALAASPIRDRLRFVSLRPHKDAADLHLSEPGQAAFTRALDEAVRRSEPSVWVAPTAAEFLDETENSEPALYAGLPAHGIAAFSGKPRSYKSMAALQMSFATAAGGPFLGRDCQRAGEVLYVVEDEDQRHDLQERIRHFEAAHPGAKERVRVMYHRGVVMTSPASVRMIRDTLDAMSGPVLLVLDTWARVRDGDENDAQATALNLRPVHDIARDYSLLALIVHHDAKHSDGRAGDHLRGSGALYAATNAVWQFEVDVAGGMAQRTGRLTIEPKSGQAERVRYEWDVATFLVGASHAAPVEATPAALAEAAERLDPRGTRPHLGRAALGVPRRQGHGLEVAGHGGSQRGGAHQVGSGEGHAVFLESHRVPGITGGALPVTVVGGCPGRRPPPD